MSNDRFEAWWAASGQFGRAGGGEYEKTFAFNAWNAALAAAPVAQDPKEIVHCQRCNMRDNHTFAQLPDDDSEALVKLEEVLAAPLGRYGMLCATVKQRDGGDGNPRPKSYQHRGETWDAWKEGAQKWLALTPAVPSQATPTTPEAL